MREPSESSGLIRRLRAGVAQPLSGAGEDQRARIIGTLLPPIALFIAGVALPTGLPFLAVYFIPFALLPAAWLLLRRGRTTLAGLAATLACGSIPFIIHLLEPFSHDFHLETLWLTLALLTAGLALPIRLLLPVLILSLAGAGAHLFQHKAMPQALVAEEMLFFTLVALLMLAHSLAVTRSEALLTSQWLQIRNEIARREETERALRESEELLLAWDRRRGRFIADIIGAQEQERMRIARELHDGIGQSLTNLLVRLGALSERDGCQREADGMRRITSEILTDLGRISKGLHPTVLDDLGLEAGLRQLADDVARTHGLAVDVHLGEVLGEELPPLHQITIYRMAQEALHNAAKHSGGRTISVLLDRRPPDGLRLIVEDDGVGFDATAMTRGQGSGLGLRSLRERAGLLGGALSIESSPGAGTAVVIDLPLEGVAS